MSHTSKDSVVEQINKAQLIKQPWKHWTVRDILPSDIITQLHKDNHFDEWPDSSEKNSLFITTSNVPDPVSASTILTLAKDKLNPSSIH